MSPHAVNPLFAFSVTFPTTKASRPPFALVPFPCPIFADRFPRSPRSRGGEIRIHHLTQAEPGCAASFSEGRDREGGRSIAGERQHTHLVLEVATSATTTTALLLTLLHYRLLLQRGVCSPAQVLLCHGAERRNTRECFLGPHAIHNGRPPCLVGHLLGKLRGDEARYVECAL